MSEVIGRLSSGQRQGGAMAIDALMLPLALWCAIALGRGEWAPDVWSFWPAFLVGSLAGVPTFTALGLYRHIIRYMGQDAIFAVIKGVTVMTIAITATAYMVPLKGFPHTTPVIFWLISLVYVMGTRFVVRAYIQHIINRLSHATPVLIYGAGSTGIELAYQLRQSGDHRPVAFLDDNPKLEGMMIHDLKVYRPEALGQLIVQNRVRQILLAMPSTTHGQRRRIISFLEPYGVRVRVIPDIDGLLSGSDHIQPRDVQPEDLLGRDAVEAMPHLLAGSVHERVVMVTGAGGSIGSELCRQIVRQEPRRLVMLEQSEYALFRIDDELRQIAKREGRDVVLEPMLGSVSDETLVRHAMRRFGIETLYHAAAYKHVGLVESNAVQGIENNTIGTLRLALAAKAQGVENFIFISTDKAVRTTSIMGASKRLAEMVLQALQESGGRAAGGHEAGGQVKGGATRFSIVRFGNVLGSSGSVVPLFLRQIEMGGPVTVTHPEATRYFMTIPEAAELVLQAGSLGRGGDVFLLDMGQPVKILGLAKRLIRLRGYSICDDANPDGDIEIRFTGLKPGEKIYEELLVGDTATGTEHPRIVRAEEAFMPWSELSTALQHLEDACTRHDVAAVRSILDALVEGTDLEGPGAIRQDDEPPAGADVLRLPRR